MFDVVIVGAGVSGCAAARELSRYKLTICVLEKASDVAMGTSKANSAIIHAGFDAEPGTLKAKLNAEGNAMFPQLSKELNFPFIQNGSLVVCFSQERVPELESLLEKGRRNGIKNLEILSHKQALEKNPNLSSNVCAALYAPTAGIVCPYEFTISLAESAYSNGAEFRFNTQVTEIRRSTSGYTLMLDSGEIVETKAVINAAGLYADEINNMISAHKLKIVPRKGEYCLFDKSAGGLVNETVFQLPNSMGKGVLVTRTVDGNLLVGPNAVDIEDKSDVDTTASGIDYVLKTAQLSINDLPLNQIITSFAGLRAHLGTDDFLIGEAADAENFFNVAGIESPGLTSAPAIGRMVAKMVAEKLSPEINSAFNPVRHGIPKFREMSNDARRKMIAQNPAYGKVVCRCETVTEAEIVDAIRRPLGARSLDGVKRRTRAGMGRCQSGFCSTRVIEILSRELGEPYTAIEKSGAGSELLVGVNKLIENEGL